MKQARRNKHEAITRSQRNKHEAGKDKSTTKRAQRSKHKSEHKKGPEKWQSKQLDGFCQVKWGFVETEQNTYFWMRFVQN